MHTILHKKISDIRTCIFNLGHSHPVGMSCVDLAGGAQIRLAAVGTEDVEPSEARLEGDVIVFGSESIVKSRTLIQVPTHETSLNHLKTMLGLKGRKKTVADEDDEGSRSPKRKTSIDDISDDEESEESEEESESEGLCDSDS